MRQYLEWDFDNPKHRQRRRRKPLPLEGEVLGPELEVEPTPRIRVEVTHRYQPRHHSAPPIWLIVLLILAAVMWISPFGAVIALVMLGIFVSAYPTLAFTLLAALALVIVVGLHQRWRGHRF
jgi:hypothetical protein